MPTAVMLSVSEEEMMVCLDSVRPLSRSRTLGVNPPSCTILGEATTPAPTPALDTPTSHRCTR